MNEQSQFVIDTRAVEELIVERAKRSYARLPMLEVVFDRFALSLSQALKTYLGAVVDVTLAKMDYLTCQDAIDSLPEPALIGVTEAVEWGGTIAAALRPEMLYSILEITFGGRTVPESPRSPRTFTGIEKRIGKAFCERTLAELSAAFEKVTPVRFEIGHLETNPKALMLGPPTSSCARAVLRINIEDRVGEMVFLLPTTALDAVGDVLSQQFTGGQLGGDTGWRMKLTEKLGTTNIPVAAVLGETNLSLREVLSWMPGQILDLGMQVDDPVTICVTGKTIARAEVGRRKNGKIALKVSEKLYEEEELPNVLLD